MDAPSLPRAFIAKRLHSLTGLCIVLFLIEHLLTNSQAALFLGEDGKGFIDAVNWLQSLPYLPAIELGLLGLPIAIHAWWGIRYTATAQPNSMRSDGSKPSLRFGRNRAYTWQRITAIVLVVAIAWHVTVMRFIQQPVESGTPLHPRYSVELTNDPGLRPLCERLDVALEEQGTQLTATARTAGTAMLLMVRDTFRSVWSCIWYSLFVAAACFHSCNGLWTAAISWGLPITERGRFCVRVASNMLMALLALFGLMAIWGSYWLA